MTQLKKLVQPFPRLMIKKAPQGKYGDYVSHPVINQRLLELVGPFSFEVRELIRGYVPELPATTDDRGRKKPAKPAIENAVVGVIGSLTVEVDGQRVTISEIGDCEQPHNWNNDGARAKDASSDSLKRCAMRLGLGLHLWAQEEFYLFAKLQEREAENTNAPTEAGA